MEESIQSNKNDNNDSPNIHSKNWKEWLSKANQFYEKKEYDPAINLFSNILKVKSLSNSEKANLYYQRSRSFWKKGDYISALTDLSAAIGLKDDEAEYYNLRAICLVNLSPDDRSKALADYTLAIQLESNNAIYHSNRANCYYDIKQYSCALIDYTTSQELEKKTKIDEMIKTTRKHIEQEYENFLLLYEKKDTPRKEMLGYFDKILSLLVTSYFKEKRAEIYHLRSSYNLKANDIAAALSDCQEAVNLSPNNPVFHNYLGVILDRLQKYSESIESFERAIKLNKKSSDYPYHCGLIYSRIGKFSLAIEKFTAAIALNPTNHSYYAERAIAFEQQSDYQNAIEDCTRAINIKPTHTNSYTRRVSLYEKLCQTKNAIDDYNQLIILDPLNSFSYYNSLGNIFLHLRRKDSAYASFVKARDLAKTLKHNISADNPDDAWFFKCEGYISIHAKDYKDALAWYNIAIKLRPETPEYHFQRGYIFYKLEDFDAAKADFDLVIDLKEKDSTSKYEKMANKFKQKIQKKTNKKSSYTQVQEQLISVRFEIEDKNKQISELQKELHSMQERLQQQEQEKTQQLYQIKELTKQMEFLFQQKELDNSGYKNEEPEQQINHGVAIQQ